MGRSVIIPLRKSPGLLAVIIAAISAVILVLNGCGLVLGITNVLPHLFYIPIILTSYLFPRRGILFACALSGIYAGMVFIIHPAFPGDLLPAAGRIVMFVTIAAVVSLLTLRMQESEQQFRGVAERSSDIILLTDTTGKALYVSPSIQKILGYHPAEITGQMPGPFIHPDDLAVLQDAVVRIVQGAVPEEIPIRMRKKDGDYAVLEFSGSPVIHEGHITGIQIIGRDITERRKTEQALRDVNRHLTDIIDFLPDPTMVINADGTVAAWNRALEKLTGVPATSILGKGEYAYAEWFYREKRPVLIDLVMRNDEAEIARQYPRHQWQGHTILAEAETVQSDGTRIEFWITATPLFNHAGEIVGAIESLRDVTHQKAIARALRESKKYTDAIINTISDPVFVKDRKHRFATLNDGFCRFTGHTREELFGKTDYDFFPREEADIFRRKDEEVFSTREINENEETLTDGQGNRHTIVTKKSLYVDGNGGEFLVGIIRDISERKQMETALRVVNKKLNLLSSITRHDIRNQLMALNAYISLSEDAIGNPVELKEFIAKEQKIADSIALQIAFTKDYENLGVKSAIWQDVSMLARNAGAALPLRNILLDIDCPGIEVFADPLLEKVFYNLIDNSLRYGGEKMTAIRVTAGEAGETLRIICEDDGNGVSDEDKKQLFTRGFGRNTGLGLFLSREILSITDITITESGEPGKGARFVMVVPDGAWRSADKK